MDLTVLHAARLKLAIEEIDGNTTFLHPEIEMKELLGANYEAYRDALMTPLMVPNDHLSTYARSWSEAWEKLLHDAQQALNFKHVSIGTNNVGAAKKRVEAIQSRAELLNQLYEEQIRDTADEIHFELRNGIMDKYHDAQVLIEHWFLPRLKKPHNVDLTDLQFKQQTQRQHLQEFHNRLAKPTPEPTQALPQSVRDRIAQMKKLFG